MNEGWFQIEFSELYDGWILEFNSQTKEIKWRDHYKANELTPQQKEFYEKLILNSKFYE